MAAVFTVHVSVAHSVVVLFVRALVPVTQLYVSVDAGSKEDLKRIDRPLFRDFWQRYLDSLEALGQKVRHLVFMFRCVCVCVCVCHLHTSTCKCWVCIHVCVVSIDITMCMICVVWLPWR